MKSHAHLSPISVPQLSTHRQQSDCSSDNVLTLCAILPHSIACFQRQHSPLVCPETFFVQCTCICMINLACSLIYVYMEFFTPPFFFVHLGHITWQLGNGE
ncbi:hypothetical protein ANCDUO_12818 [Ancylostoma duodenale]|uniref:7TM GPCR serpentine receptor class x (Srx) domain-containing protein n=1 Tax=Ancylostoma duodenale TaxID=51022 RepID=A0A0C2D4E9_9BILA|nr:hypothetical protein ANCDUO_12818 [Ancylostoma duodenale]